MKTIKTKYLSLVRRLGKVPISLILALALVLVLAASAMATTPTYTEQWDGRGTDSMKCVIEDENDPRYEFMDTGWIHWIFSTKGDSTDASLVLGGTGSGTYAPGEPLNAEVWHFYTPYFDLEGLTATIYLFGGEPGPGGGLVISDYCPEEPYEELEVSKTAVTYFTREHFWDIDKGNDGPYDEGYEGPKLWLDQPPINVDPTPVTVTWTIDVTYDDFEDSDWNVSGEITIENTGNLDAVITAVDDVLAGDAIDVYCGVAFPYPLPVGETLTCTYSEDVDGEIEGFNEVTVTTERDEYFADAEINWGDPDVETNKTVNIVDISDLDPGVTNPLGSVTAPNGDTFTYSEDFVWSSEKCGSHIVINNTATIVETEQSASSILYINIRCEDLLVTKEVDTYFERTHEWDIAKMVETENEEFLDGVPKIWLYADGSGNEIATWTIDVTYEGAVDSDWNVSGRIFITNIDELDAVILSVVDELGGTPIDVDCPVTFPYTLPEGETLTCTYDEDGYFEGLNEVTVTTQRAIYEAFADIVWGEPDEVYYETVNIEDISDLFGTVNLGSVTAPDGAQFTYSKAFAWGDYDPDKCEIPYMYANTATIIETGQSASATLKVNVQCVFDESAWAKGDPNVPFCEYFSNWGWTNPIGPGTYEWPLWAGAAQCDTSKGTLVGSVTVVYNGDGMVTVTYNVAAPYFLESTAVYADIGMFPLLRNGRPTVAPGQYYNASPFEGEQVYVIAHAVVTWPDPNFGP